MCSQCVAVRLHSRCVWHLQCVAVRWRPTKVSLCSLRGPGFGGLVFVGAVEAGQDQEIFCGCCGNKARPHWPILFRGTVGKVANVERFVQDSFTTTYTPNIQAQHTDKFVCLTVLLFSSYTVINRTVGKSTTYGHFLHCGWGRTSLFLIRTSMLLRKVHIATGGSQMVCLLK